MKKITLLYWKDANWWVGRIKERPDVFSQGKTLNELKENIRDAYSLMEDTDNWDVPADHRTMEIMIEAN